MYLRRSVRKQDANPGRSRSLQKNPTFSLYLLVGLLMFAELPPAQHTIHRYLLILHRRRRRRRRRRRTIMEIDESDHENNNNNNNNILIYHENLQLCEHQVFR